MSVKYAPSKLRVPNGFQYLLEALAREILREQPENIIKFADEYFKRKLKERAEGSTVKDVPTKSSDSEVPPGDGPPAPPADQGASTEEEEAAIKIQSLMRGAQARKEVLALRASVSKANVDNSVEQGGTTEQAVEGDADAVNLENDAVLEDTHASNVAASEIEATANAETSSSPSADTAIAEVTLSQEEVVAITKIQAVFRGHKARKEVGDLRETSGEGNEQDVHTEVDEEADDTEVVVDGATELSASVEAEADGNVELTTEDDTESAENEKTDETATETTQNEKTEEEIPETDIDTKTDTETADTKSDAETADSKPDAETADIKTDTETADIKTDDETADTKTDDETADTETADIKTDTESADTKTDAESADVGTVDTSTDDQTSVTTDAETVDNKTDTETADNKTDAEIDDDKTEAETDNKAVVETTDDKDETEATGGDS